MNIVKTCKMNLFDPAANSNKVWIANAYADGTFETRYGRVLENSNLAKTTKRFSSASGAINELERKCREKLYKGYRETQTIENGQTSVTVNVDVKSVAADQIAGDDKTTRDLIEYLATVNIHNILTTTSLSYDVSNATFSTPLGVLAPNAIRDARTLLSEILQFNDADNFSSRRDYAIKDYFQIVPKSFGRKVPAAKELLADSKAIQSESAILDALETALTVTATANDKIFECKLTKVSGSTDGGRATFRTINELFKKTRNQSHHGTASRKMIRLYEVSMPSHETQFEAVKQQIGNVRGDLWHGTRASNLLSILKNGLIIPPANAAQCTGRMFGNGIYSSLQSTKALNYATQMWNSSGTHSQRTFMFFCEAAFGKSYKPSQTFRSLPSGYDSTWVEPGTAGVMNHEAIVYQPSQIRLQYLAEFE